MKNPNFYLIRGFILIVSLLLVSCATRGPQMKNSGGGIYHTVEKGQTLWRISQAYHADIDEVLKINQMVDASKIEVGQKIFIPRAQKFLNVPPAMRWTHIVIHHSATPNGNADIFDKQHRKRGFWNGLGYHFVIDNGTSGRRNGQVEVGHRWVKQIDGAHCNAMNMNKVGIGICLVGNFEKGPPTPDQLHSLNSLVTQLGRQFNIPLGNVLRHNQVAGKNTYCPGTQFPWGDFIKEASSSVLAVPQTIVPSA